jgi:hypothetical protein
MANPQVALQQLPPSLRELFAQIDRQYIPPNGWCDVHPCPHCDQGRARVEAAKQAALEAYQLDVIEVDEVPEDEGQQIYDEGYLDGRQRALDEARRWATQQISRASAVARQSGFKDGFRAGIAAAPKSSQGAPPAPASADTSKVRKQFYDQVLEECRVIGESNPQMNPAMNALRHRLKKRFR